MFVRAFFLTSLLLAVFAVSGRAGGVATRPITVVCYYFPNYHPGDPRNLKTKGPGWSEWELVKNAKPRFPGHLQPHLPLWGCLDESKPEVMAQKIAAAADHGINAFIFDWYYYNDGPFLNAAVDDGFLKATNNSRLKFAFMWANHNWFDIHPCHRGAPPRLLYPGRVTPQTFNKICDLLITNYFSRSNYWRIDGKPYFSIYEANTLVACFGSVAATRAALDGFRARARAAGLPGLHLDVVDWACDPKLARELGFDSVTSYVWVHHASLPELQTEYNDVRDQYFDFWEKARSDYDVPFIPNVTMGWDPSPRADQSQAYGNFGYPFTNTIKDNTPENFKIALEMARNRLLSETNGLRILNLNAWNEWTEGSYLEPDTVHGMGYLDAIKSVFATPN